MGCFDNPVIKYFIIITGTTQYYKLTHKPNDGEYIQQKFNYSYAKLKHKTVTAQ